jgi:hypothetical protein
MSSILLRTEKVERESFVGAYCADKLPFPDNHHLHTPEQMSGLRRLLVQVYVVNVPFSFRPTAKTAIP